MKTRFLAPLIALAVTPLHAEPPEITAVAARETATGWQFDVTLRHPDTGWEHYADGWEVLAMDGTRLGFRELLHPHVDEQPFTRSLSAIAIPADVSEVTIRARCNVDGWADSTRTVRLPR